MVDRNLHCKVSKLRASGIVVGESRLVFVELLSGVSLNPIWDLVVCASKKLYPHCSVLFNS